MTRGPAPDAAAAATDASGSPRRLASSLPLQLVLGTLVLAVVAIRWTQLGRLVGVLGADVPWMAIVARELAFWLAWSLWAWALVPAARRLTERPPPSATRAAIFVAMAVLPALLVPVVIAPVHWWAFGRDGSAGGAFSHVATHNLGMNLLLGAAIAGVVYGWVRRQRTRRLELAAARLGEQLTRAQLDALRAQLDPHFLFNALNSIAVLARRGKSADVERMVMRLADLLRHSLESSRAQVVPLRVELEALRHYVGIEEVRHGDRLRVALHVPHELLDANVPSFLLQPLVENAVRHGPADAATPLHVEVRARADGERLVIEVRDDGVGMARAGGASTNGASANGTATNGGTGLGNTRARLAGLYGGAASLALSAGIDGRGTAVTIALPLGARPAEETARA